MSDGASILTVENLSVVFARPRRSHRAEREEKEGRETPVLRDVSFSLSAGRVLALVGASGSGKSITALSIMGMIDPPGRIAHGSIRLAGNDLLRLDEHAMRSVRGARVAMIFQEPMMALNPLMRISTHMVESIQAHQPEVKRADALVRAAHALHAVGIAEPLSRLNAYPHELSGGMLQRVCIAIALLHRPDVLIADEPTTALDVSTQAQILVLVERLCAEYGMAMLWITHDLAVARALADDVAVMFKGQLVETGLAEQVLTAPIHPYTQRLVAAAAHLASAPIGETRYE